MRRGREDSATCARAARCVVGASGSREDCGIFFYAASVREVSDRRGRRWTHRAHAYRMKLLSTVGGAPRDGAWVKITSARGGCSLEATAAENKSYDGSRDLLK